MSKSHQSCSCCGWSKYTTYQGLRTHQGKMGCTPKGQSIPQSAQYQYNPLPSYSPPAASYSPPAVIKETYATVTPKYDAEPSTYTWSQPDTQTQEKSLRSCHCGWSKVTSYKGLRIHQGKMGCTPKGLRIPENLQDLYRPLAPKYEDAPKKPQQKVQRESDAAPKYVKEPSPELDNTMERRSVLQQQLNERKESSKSKPKVPSKSMIKSTPDARKAPVKEIKSYFETPEQYRPSTRDVAKTKRMLDFSIGEKRVMKNRINAEIESKVHQMTEVWESLETGKVSLNEESKEIDNMFAEMILIVEEARDRELESVEIRRASLKREADSLIKNLTKDIEKLEEALDELHCGADVDMALLTMKTEEDSLSVPFKFETLQMTVSTMIENIRLEVDQLCAGVDVKPTPNSAHHRPVVLQDGKKIQDGEQSWQFSSARGSSGQGRPTERCRSGVRAAGPCA